MNQFIRVTSLVACVTLGVFGTSCSEDPQPALPEIVNVPDVNLANQIKSILELSPSADITAEDMLNLVELNIDGSADFTGTVSEISDLRGLEFAENLTYLHFGSTKVADLTPIKDLKKIEYLRMNNTAVTDLSPISEYTTLTYFNANTARGITDISPLSKNTGLKEMILREVPMGNAGLNTIKNFTTLYRINMRNTGVTDVTVLGEMMAAGALLDTTPGAAENGGATLDLKQLSVADWSPIRPFLSQISNIEGVPAED
ncbi:leucine-rich repeat domain-containing protein [Mongoliitalea daihaiensis]|uniref:hypothetical protein n=1 Tax=Mongoliitalea daihaiensis TaxID=2782006 RepID=UPI001F331CD4|nr:hypothetical protein [Mongoliitalea daihaiensis]UJP66575.1 hypothetical protein IPZ59_08275 [Mongoliitalea daihaiensis]